MDEPLSSLDAKLRNDLRLELKRIQQDLGATMLYVTHDQTEALTLATRVGVLQQGRLVQLGTPREIYENPVSSYVASRLGAPRINLVPRAALASVAAPENATTVGIRSEHLTLNAKPAADGAQAQTARVVRIERLSDQYLIHLAIDGSTHELVAANPANLELEPGDTVCVGIRRALWFDANEQRIHA
jgi:multiple sugar transport system ATP-binding protein